MDDLIAASSLGTDGMTELCARTPDNLTATVRKAATHRPAVRRAANPAARQDQYPLMLDTRVTASGHRQGPAARPTQSQPAGGIAL